MAKKYRVIVKTAPNEFKKWSCNSLLKLQSFLDEKHPGWTWCNYYKYTKEGNGKQLGSFTRLRRLYNEPKY